MNSRPATTSGMWAMVNGKMLNNSKYRLARPVAARDLDPRQRPLARVRPIGCAAPACRAGFTPACYRGRLPICPFQPALPIQIGRQGQTMEPSMNESVHTAGMIDLAELDLIDRYWRAANYVSVGQIYLLSNPLLAEPLRAEHVKPRLLGHWGTTPGLNFIYAHLNRIIRARDIDVLYICGPGHGGPAMVANTYLEGTYSEIYPEIGLDSDGLRNLFRQFSFPGGVPSHAAPETPGSIHEGGELGYALVHACGAAFDNPDLVVACVVGDGEAETGPLAASWHSTKFLNPARDGAVLPILHLNGYKIASPTVLARISKEELTELLRGYGYNSYFVEGDDPALMHQQMASTMDIAMEEIHTIQKQAREQGFSARPSWPMIVLRSPKGWTGPKEVDHKKVEGTFRSHQVPISEFDSKPDHVKHLESWMMSYRPEELFDRNGKLATHLAELAPEGEMRMGASP